MSRICNLQDLGDRDYGNAIAAFWWGSFLDSTLNALLERNSEIPKLAFVDITTRGIRAEIARRAALEASE